MMTFQRNDYYIKHAHFNYSTFQDAYDFSLITRGRVQKMEEGRPILKRRNRLLLVNMYFSKIRRERLKEGKANCKGKGGRYF